MGAKEEKRAKEQAKAQLESIIVMVNRLEHCRDCDREDCDLTDEEIFEGINIYYEGQKPTEEEIEEYHDEESAIQAIDEDPLDISIRSDWHNLGSEAEEGEYNILLCTGGPAVRIIGELDEYKQPYTAILEYQDWFTEWAEYHCNEEETEKLVTYAQQFYFGE